MNFACQKLLDKLTKDFGIGMRPMLKTQNLPCLLCLFWRNTMRSTYMLYFNNKHQMSLLIQKLFGNLSSSFARSHWVQNSHNPFLPFFTPTCGLGRSGSGSVSFSTSTSSPSSSPSTFSSCSFHLGLMPIHLPSFLQRLGERYGFLGPMVEKGPKKCPSVPIWVWGGV